MTHVIHTNLETVSFSVQFGPLRAIVTGVQYWRLTPHEQDAVIAHEEGHIHHRHTTRRLLWLLTGWTNVDRWMQRVREQEHEADLYAVDHGHADGLLRFLDRFGTAFTASEFHPSPLDRTERICMRMCQGEPHA